MLSNNQVRELQLWGFLEKLCTGDPGNRMIYGDFEGSLWHLTLRTHPIRVSTKRFDSIEDVQHSDIEYPESLIRPFGETRRILVGILTEAREELRKELERKEQLLEG